MKKPLWEHILHLLIIALVAVQPLIDMDYLFYETLDRMGLPRFSTIIRFVILPLLVILTFFLREKPKKKVFALAAVYGLILAGYFVMHHRQAVLLRERILFTDNFIYSAYQELVYITTLVLPFAIVYLTYHDHMRREDIKRIVLFESAVISVPIVLGDLFVFGKSTYYGYTVANLFSWFTDIYNWYHPRTLASKFFFNEGNTIGILMFMLLPLLYCIREEETDRTRRRRVSVLIFLQSMSMQMLATRVATYGAVMIPVLFLVLYLFIVFIMKERRFEKRALVFPLICAVVFALMLERTPAVQNQKVDAINDTALINNPMGDIGREELKNAEDLVPGSKEWIDFYVYMFEAYGINARYIQSVPSMYYTEYYSYQVDPKFWVDVTFMDVYDRVSGRQIERIFFNYKYQELSSKEKILGMGYSTFMNGSIVLEQDFLQQIYTLGYAGFVICILPWFALILYGGVMFLKHFRKMFTLENLCMMTAIGAAFGSAWLSGHVLDQFVTSVFMAFLAGVLLDRIREAKA